MLWKSLSPTLSKGQFQRLTGVKRRTFEKMCFIIKAVKELRRRHAHRGKKPKLCIEDHLLMMLMYNREYRTFFHISRSYGISESQCWRIINDIEDILIQSGAFRLPGKKALLKSTVKWSVVLIDVGETPVERPKKTTQVLFWQKETSYPQNTIDSGKR